MVAVMPSIFGSRISVLISVLSLVFVIIVLSLVAGWFWGVPSRVTEQEQVICQDSALSHLNSQIVGSSETWKFDWEATVSDWPTYGTEVRELHGTQSKRSTSTGSRHNFCPWRHLLSSSSSWSLHHRQYPEMALSSTVKNMQTVHIRWLPWKHEQLSYGYGLWDGLWRTHSNWN